MVRLFRGLLVCVAVVWFALAVVLLVIADFVGCGLPCYVIWFGVLDDVVCWFCAGFVGMG